MDLEESNTPFEPVEDKRAKIPEPLPVMLVAISDCTLPARNGLETQLDQFYIEILQFQREALETGLVYRAENLRLRFELAERLGPREDYLPLGLTVRSLTEVIKRLTERGFEHTYQRKLTLVDTILVYDPAGNLLEIGQTRGMLG